MITGLTLQKGKQWCHEVIGSFPKKSCNVTTAISIVHKVADPKGYMRSTRAQYKCLTFHSVRLLRMQVETFAFIYCFQALGPLTHIFLSLVFPLLLERYLKHCKKYATEASPARIKAKMAAYRHPATSENL